MCIDLSEILGIGDERVRVGGHVHAEETRLVCDWVCHGEREGGDGRDKRGPMERGRTAARGNHIRAAQRPPPGTRESTTRTIVCLFDTFANSNDTHQSKLVLVMLIFLRSSSCLDQRNR